MHLTPALASITANLAWAQMSPGIRYALITAVAFQILLLASALVLWFRTPPAIFGSDPKYVWLAVILLANTIGPLIFIIVRTRRMARAHRSRETARARNLEGSPSPSSSSTHSATELATLLYSDPEPAPTTPANSGIHQNSHR
ncbi:hypothetical protein I6E29_05285 [Arcanobacterium haemolyticum]|nr:hypothetical protein [Arcanobacterium haemolyticum]